jgi:hypothetical protein
LKGEKRGGEEKGKKGERKKVPRRVTAKKNV